MNAHTPGPWVVVIDGTCSCAWPHIVQEAFADDTGYAIAELSSCFLEKHTRGAPVTYQEKPSRFRKSDDHEEVMANARLIAAAPELLACAKRLASALRSAGIEPDAHSDNPLRSLLHETEAAIAKATGEGL